MLWQRTFRVSFFHYQFVNRGNYSSGAKFWSSCGWPAFGESVGEDKNIVRIQDNSYGMERVEVRCKVCNAHLGHVFDEESAPKGERYCINSCSIKLIPDNA